jgi:hypothetical protein
MISIRKYLDLKGASKSEPVEPRESHVLADLCSRILDQVGSYVSAGEATPELQARLENAKTAIGDAMGPKDALCVEDAVRIALSGRAAHERETAQRVAVETQQVVGVLNDALMALSGGSQRSLSRLHRIQESLQRTSLIRDTDGLRASLADAVKLIREETAREQEHAARDLAAFESEVIKVRRQIVSNPVRRLPEREEGIRACADGLLTLKPGSSLYAIAFRFANINAMIQRYGPEPVNELFFQVIRERIPPLATVHTSCRWSSGCVVSVIEGSFDPERLQSELAELCREPLVYRMTLGSRTALLKVGVSHLIVPVTPDTFQTQMDEMDRFAGTVTSNAA